MNERQLLVRTAAEVIAASTPERHGTGSWQPELWKTLAELGFAAIGVREDLAGAGGTFADAAAVANVAAAQAAAVPLAETLLAAHVLASAGVAPRAEPLTLAAAAGRVELTPDGSGLRVTGRLERVPWARYCTHAVIVADGAPGPALVTLSDCELRAGENVAGEPRDDLLLDVIARQFVWDDAWSERRLTLAAAVLRVAQLAGALAAIRDLTIAYVREREQFGRPLASFQAVQHQLAALVSIAAAAAVASEYAADSPCDDVTVAASKAYVGRTSGTAASIAHQLHGAIGLTEEYSLQLLTRRVWAWRDEFGSDVQWELDLGRSVHSAGSAVWDMVAADARDRG